MSKFIQNPTISHHILWSEPPATLIWITAGALQLWTPPLSPLQTTVNSQNSGPRQPCHNSVSSSLVKSPSVAPHLALSEKNQGFSGLAPCDVSYSRPLTHSAPATQASFPQTCQAHSHFMAFVPAHCSPKHVLKNNIWILPWLCWSCSG